MATTAQQVLAADFTRFNPRNIAGLKLWLRADTLLGTDGSVIAAWPDLSGTSNDATQVTGSLQPILKRNIVNGRSVVRFDGVGQFLKFTSTDVDGTGIVVAAVNAALSSQSVYAAFLITQGNGTYGVRLCARVTAAHWGTYSFTDIDAGEGLTIGAFNIIEGTSTHTGFLTNLYRNGVQKVTNFTQPMTSDTVAYSQVGAEQGTRYCSCDIAEVLLFDSVLSSANRILMEKFLGSFYNIPV